MTRRFKDEIITYIAQQEPVIVDELVMYFEYTNRWSSLDNINYILRQLMQMGLVLKRCKSFDGEYINIYFLNGGEYERQMG